MSKPPQLPDESTKNYARFLAWCAIPWDTIATQGSAATAAQIGIKSGLYRTSKSKYNWEQRRSETDPNPGQTKPKRTKKTGREPATPQEFVDIITAPPERQPSAALVLIPTEDDDVRAIDNLKYQDRYFDSAMRIACCGDLAAACAKAFFTAALNGDEISKDLEKAAQLALRYYFPRGLLGLDDGTLSPAELVAHIQDLRQQLSELPL